MAATAVSFEVVFMDVPDEVNVLNQVKAAPEICTDFCASATQVDVLIATTARGRGIVGVIDGSPPVGVETKDDVTALCVSVQAGRW